MKTYILSGCLFICAACDAPMHAIPQASEPNQAVSTAIKIGDIPLPENYDRLPLPASSFGQWMRKLPLKKDTKVYLYNGTLKGNQSAQYAVLDLSVGTKDLQQCADAVMRLRA